MIYVLVELTAIYTDKLCNLCSSNSNVHVSLDGMYQILHMNTALLSDATVCSYFKHFHLGRRAVINRQRIQ